MSYITWRKTNEDRVLQKVNDGELHELPAWKVSSTSELTDAVITPVADAIIEKAAMIPMGFPCVFAEYLFEEYHVSSADVELFSQVVLKGNLKYISEEIQKSVQRTVKFTQEHAIESAMNRIVDMMPDDLKEAVREAVETAIQANNEMRDDSGISNEGDGSY